VLLPLARFTKRDLIAYYLRVAPLIVPHLAGHPVTLHRFPNGPAGPDFYQSRAPSTPPWVRRTTLHFPRTGKTFDAVVIDDAASLIWAANLSTVEFHPYLGLAGAVDRPRAIVFDLDPGPPAALAHCAVVAIALRALLDGLGLESLVKTSGATGLHVYVPLAGRDDYETTKPLARAIAARLRAQLPDLVIDVMTRSARTGKVFIDWAQNDRGKSTVAPYSLRGLPVATVSMPLEWDEVRRVAEGGDPSQLVFDVPRALMRIDDIASDLFGAAIDARQVLTTATAVAQ
jgi:bifunctional non-homologous end joining protein LigD